MLYEDLRTFLDKEEWYPERGLPCESNSGKRFDEPRPAGTYQSGVSRSSGLPPLRPTSRWQDLFHHRARGRGMRFLPCLSAIVLRLQTTDPRNLFSQLDLDMYVLSLSQGGLDDGSLLQLVVQCSESSILLIEDIDAAFVGRDKTGSNPDTDGSSHSQSTNSVGFAALLQLMDGAASAGESFRKLSRERT